MKKPGLLAPQFRDEDAAREHIEKQRWPDGPECPHCGLVNEATKLEPRPGSNKAVRKGVWNCRGCRKQFTVTIGSIFEDSHIPLHKWLLAIHLMASSKKGISAHQLMRNLEIGSYRSAWFMAHRIRWALTQEPIKEALDGVVEMDETYIGGKRRYTVSRATKPGERPRDFPGPFDQKAAVVSVLQRGGGVRSQYMERVTAANLRPIVEEMVAKDAHLMTDSSNVLASAGSKRKHSHVNHRAKEYVRMEDGQCITTNTIEGYFSILKRGNYGVYHHWSKKYLGQYLREFDWRYNVRRLPDMERAVIALKMTGGKRLMLRSPAQQN
ncbi:MAG: IS1595 family transposase [Acidobacteria bacterium]|nr:IS1595 family transposase [Acidobacteriota bacterium]